MKRLLVLLATLWGCATASADPDWEQPRDRQGQVQAELEALRARLARPINSGVPSPFVAERTALLARQEALETEYRGLASAMRRYSQEEDRSSQKATGRLNLPGLAYWLVTEVDERVKRGEWVPLGREKAPFILAAIVRHEVSWRWEDPRVRGALGEGCAFQIAPSTARMVGFAPETIAHDRRACFEAAMKVFTICTERCGEHPFERVLGCYATSGTCGGVPEVVEQRFVTARKLQALALLRGG